LPFWSFRDRRVRVSAAFDVTVVNINGRAVVFMSGEIDLTAQARIREALRTAAQGSADVIVDLSQVTFIDTTGINALVGARRRARDGRFHVVGASGQIRNVLEITGVAQYLADNDGQTSMWGSVDDAIRALDG
jgi:anti-anti-sigma factor